MKIRYGLACLALAAGIALASPLTAQAGKIPEEELKIAEGVYAENVALGGLTEQEALTRLEEEFNAQKSKSLIVDVNGEQASVTLGELGLTWKNPEIAQEAALLGRGGSVVTRYKAMEQLRHETRELNLILSLDEAALDRFISTQVEAFNKEPVEPALKRRDGAFTISDSHTGMSVNVEKTRRDIVFAVLEPWEKDTLTVNATVEVTQPVHDGALLYQVTDRIGTCTTVMSNMGNKNRVHNVTLGSKNANGTIVWPGEEVSWSEILGPRNEENGWAVAAEYVNGGSKEDYGGGICQTATTMYGALLDAEVKVTERWPHSRVIWYAPMAQDAAMSGTYKDLKFRNDFDVPIYLECYVSGNKVVYNIYGKETRPSNRRVEYVSEVLSETDPGYKDVPDPSMLIGTSRVTTKAYPAVKATLTKNVYMDGKLVESTLLHTDNYKALQGVRAVGTKQPEPEPEPETQAPKETSESRETKASSENDGD